MKTSHLRTAAILFLMTATNLRAADTHRSNPIDFGESHYKIVRGPSSALHIPACGALPSGKQFSK